MSFYHRAGEKRRIIEDFELSQQEVLDGICRASPKIQLENEKRMRREIANSNERRRMQSINTGFQMLRSLLPHHEGEKLSKAAILQQTSEVIQNFEQEKNRLIAQNLQLKRMLSEATGNLEMSSKDSPLPKRRKRDTESSDEGISMNFTETDDATSVATTTPTSGMAVVDELRREVAELRYQVEHERRLRLILEEQQAHSQHLLAAPLRHIANQVQAHVQFQKTQEALSHSHQHYLQRIQHETAKVDEPKCNSTKFQSNMSRRNLQTIVEAIRHLEGEQALGESKDAQNSEGESTMSTVSDQDDVKSESSGRGSPVSFTGPLPLPKQEFPVALHLIQAPLSAQLAPPPQFFTRPGVIVQKSS